MIISSPRLTDADGWLLAALTESSGRLVPLFNLVHDYDWLNRAIPTFDDLSFGMPRLVAAGYAIVSESPSGELLFGVTPEAMRLRRSANATWSESSALRSKPSAGQWRTAR
jgi:hypothetical protein